MADNILSLGDSVSSLLVKSIASTVKDYHVNRAIEFFSKKSLYWGLGHPNEWENSTVKTPEYNDKLIEPWGFKKVAIRNLVVPVENLSEGKNIIEFQSQKFKVINIKDAHAEACRWVYLRSVLTSKDIATKSFSQVSIQTGLIPMESKDKDFITLSEVKDMGYTEILNNRTTVTADVDVKINLALILEF